MTIPLRGQPADEPYAGRRLLLKALVVVNFSPVLGIAGVTGEFIAGFQDEIRAQYPLVNLEHEQFVQLEADDVGLRATTKALPVWRFRAAEGSWLVSLTPESISLEVDGSDYTGWAEFADRIAKLVASAEEYFHPSHRRRIGVRYINAAATEDGVDPRSQCAAELVSISGDPELVQSDLVWRFAADEGVLILRSGVALPESSYDPRMVQPFVDKSWYLDIDVVNEDLEEFDQQRINSAMLQQVRRAHAVYRWAMHSSKEA